MATNTAQAKRVLNFFPGRSADEVVALRYDGCLLMDVEDGLPQGDPDAGNAARKDSDGHVVITNSGFNRRVRDYVLHVYPGVPGMGIWMKRGAILSDGIDEARAKAGLAEVAPDVKKDKGGNTVSKKAGKAKATDEVEATKAVMLRDNFDVRTFGGVMTSGPGAGKARGAVQMFLARSVDQVDLEQIAITRTSGSGKGDKEQTMGTRHSVRYALMRCPFAISPFDAKSSGFTYGDLDVFVEAMIGMIELFWSGCSSGRRTCRGFVLFEHESPLGRARATDLHSLLKIEKKDGVDQPSSYGDYNVSLGKTPEGVKAIVLVDPTTK